jgi:hypothetical protein
VVPRGALIALLGLTTLLPIAIVLVVGTSLLLSGLHDAAAARALNGVALALGLFWILCLIGLTIALAFDALGRREGAADEVGDDQHDQ